MIFLILFTIVVLATVIGSLICYFDPEAPKARGPFIGGTIVALLIAIPFSIATIDTGHTGLVYQIGTGGKIIGHMGPGLNFKLPWHGVRQVNTQVQKAEYDNQEGFTKETQPVVFDMTLNYQVLPNSIDHLYSNVGPDWRATLLDSRAVNDAKEAANAYLAVDVAPHREDIRKATAAKLRTEMAPYGIDVTSVQVKNIHFSPAFTHSIELKQQQTQAALTAEAKVRQAQAEAQQAVATAKGRAQSTLIEATAQAESNRKLSASITPELVNYTQALNLGRLAQGGKVQLIPSNAFIQVPAGK